ncbi:MAG: RDD family protein [Candidatus Eisenbacteria bacterium]|nr:RDD family protein [Candidatus Eisenbacteria bacterium]
MFCAQCGQWLSEGEAVCSRCGAPVHGGAAGVSAPALPEPATAVHPPSVAHAADAMIPGGFWRRFASGIVDTLVLFFPTAIVRVLSGMDAWGSGNPMDAALLRAGVINLLLYWLYCAVLESSRAQGTLGQQLLGLRVCDDRMRRISFLRATGRNWAQWLSGMTCGLGYLLNLWTRRRQTLHDLVAGCLVVRSPEAGAAHQGPA